MNEQTPGNGPSPAEIEQGLTEIFREQLDYKGPLHADLRLAADARLDSLQMVTLVVELEQRFGLELERGDEQGVRTFADLVELVRKKIDA